MLHATARSVTLKMLILAPVAVLSLHSGTGFAQSVPQNAAPQSTVSHGIKWSADERTFPHGGEGLGAICDWLLTTTGKPADAIAVAIEVSDVDETRMEIGFPVGSCGSCSDAQ